MSIFDPLGVITPFSAIDKVLMRRIWQSVIFWDEKIREDERVV
jgi:hypothetical protein